MDEAVSAQQESVTKTAKPYPKYRWWVQALAVALVAATFVLVAIGGHVTSTDAGMSVPDGFTTFGVWSLIAPLETWWYQSDTRLEHGHRLKGYVVGWLSIGLLVALLLTQGRRRWLKGLGVGLLVFVVIQGVMGILRVDEVSLVLAGVHGVTGQVFLCLTVLAAAAVGRRWMAVGRAKASERGSITTTPGGSVRWLPVLLLAALLLQLSLGSAVRHGQAALAIPDWPMHYGEVLPPMSQGEIDRAVAAVPADQRPERFAPARVDEQGVKQAGTYAPWQVHVHLSHRVMGYTIFVLGVLFVAWLVKRYADRPAVLVPAGVFLVALCLQVLLGVMTVLSGEHATLATSHQTVGAVLFASATWLTVRLHLVPRPAALPTEATQPAAAAYPREARPA
ncbi:MAG: COX15/CtaA family protein [Planctomycetota bacterium]